jgi:hypothetical protein
MLGQPVRFLPSSLVDRLDRVASDTLTAVVGYGGGTRWVSVANLSCDGYEYQSGDPFQISAGATAETPKPWGGGPTSPRAARIA